MNTRETLKINERGHLEIGGCDATELVARFGTPLYVLDEDYVRSMCRVFHETLTREYDGNGRVLYASKALSCLAVYAIVSAEGLGVDVVSGGELATALAAGVSAEQIVFHGNNKTENELKMALDCGVGLIVVDGQDEAEFLEEICAEKNAIANVLLRVNPGVEAHTHAYIQTAKVDSKFGLSVKTGDALEGARCILGCPHLTLKGFHCHIGSQIFEREPFRVAVDVMTDFMATAKKELSFTTEILNLGGGFGIWYTDEDRKISVAEYGSYLSDSISALKSAVKTKKLVSPMLMIEPGRSIVGEAGVTLYRVGNVKDIKEVRKYVSVDGGMYESPRFALYQARYSALLANRANDANEEIVTVAGKCCESGDVIAENIALPKVRRGDILAVLSTGAYHYSMASNYNRNPIPPMVLVKDGTAEYIVKPQSYEDLMRNDVMLSRLMK